MKSKSRILELDGLRTLAISSVLLIHFWSGRLWVSFGWAGVDLFFVISGFLITGILLDLRSSANPFRTFYWRRVLRIFPPYYAVLAVIAFLMLAHHEGFYWSEWAPYLAFVTALRTGISFHLIFHRMMGQLAFDLGRQRLGFGPNVSFKGFETGLTVFWSLSVEELFYLFWAPVILKCPRRWIIVFAIAPLVVCPVLRGLTHTSDYKECFGFITRFDALAAGACVALLLRSTMNLSKWVLAPLPVAAASLAWLTLHAGFLQHIEPRSSELFSIFGYSLIALIFAYIVWACVHWQGSPWLAPLRLWPMIYIGTISYMMYLIHFTIYALIAQLASGELFRAVMATALTILVAALSWRYFESPILRLKNWGPKPNKLTAEFSAALSEIGEA